MRSLPQTPLTAALEYRELGISSVPLYPRSKRPHAGVIFATSGDTGWRTFQQRIADEPEIRQWFSLEPQAGVGIVCGDISGNLLVADVDELEEDPLIHMPTGYTPFSHSSINRYHSYFRGDLGERSWKPEWGDVLANGRMVVAPPSLHPGGHAYRWSTSMQESEIAHISSGWGLQWILRPPSQTISSLVSTRWLVEEEEQREQREQEPSHQHLITAEPSRVRARELPLGRVKSAVQAALPVLGIHAEIDRTFRCVLPGHDERNPSASIHRCDDGSFRYHDWHQREDREWYSLAEVFASITAGYMIDELDSPAASKWWDRLFYEARVIEATPEPLWLPQNASETLRRVADGFSLLWALRNRTESGPTPYTRRFASQWCGISEWKTREAIRKLRDLGSIMKVGEHQVGRYTYDLFIPG